MMFPHGTATTDSSSDFPGRNGPTATTEADPRDAGPVRTSYAPDRDGDPDPGEIVWTWVPFEENDGRGKDRPVLVVAREAGGTLLADGGRFAGHFEQIVFGILDRSPDSAARAAFTRTFAGQLQP